MNNLEVRAIKVTPAVIQFNYDEILKVAKDIKKQYEGLVFVEETVKEGKSTVAEMKKIQKSINDFKIKTKKDLTKSVTEFETQCKTIMAEFDEPIEFIQSQLADYEQKRVEQKTKNIQKIIDELRKESEIDDRFWDLQFDPKWTNKTVGHNEITENVINQINQMIAKQNAYTDRLEVIKMQVELANAKHQLSVEIDPQAFYNLAEHKESSEIKEIIMGHAERQKESETAYAEKVKVEAERKAQEEANAKIKENDIKTAETISKMSEHIDKFIPLEAQEQEKRYERTISIKGTKSQLQALKNYMDQIGIEVI